MTSLLYWFAKTLFRSTIAYEIAEHALRTGDIVFYNDNSTEASSIQKPAPTPNETRLARARCLSSLCSILPWNACMIDDRSEQLNTSTGGTVANEIDAAETAMQQRWNTWQHATLVVVLPDATAESNPTKNPKKTLPYVFVPGLKNKLELMPLRTLLAQTRSETFAVRHLLIDDTEALPVNVDKQTPSSSPLLGTVVLPASPSVATRAQQASTANLKILSSNKRSFIQTSIVEFFSEIYNLKYVEGSAAVYERAQVVQLILREPAMLHVDRDGKPIAQVKPKSVTASNEYLLETFAERNSATARADLYSKTELLPLFLASPAYLAFYALYAARITNLLPRAQHTAEHLRDTGIVDSFLTNSYSLSDEVGIHFTLPLLPPLKT